MKIADDLAFVAVDDYVLVRRCSTGETFRLTSDARKILESVVAGVSPLEDEHVVALKGLGILII